MLSLAFKVLKSNFLDVKPYKLTFAVTYVCNSRCTTCNIWKFKPKHELTTDEIINFFKENKFLWINLTGGEPFLRKDLIKIIGSFAEDVSLLNTTTNGLLCENIVTCVKKILDLNLNRLIVTVSLDGDKEVYKKIRGVDGFDKAIKTFSQLRRLAKEHKNFSTFLGYTISKQNVGLLKKTYEAVKKKVPDLSLKEFHTNIYHESEIYYGNIGQKEYPENVLNEIKWFLKFKSGINPIDFLENKYLKLLKSYITRHKSPLPCKALTSSIFIDPYGNVYPCTIFPEKLGNIKEKKLDIMLKTEKTRKIKEKIKKLECPNCWTPCEAYQTILGNLRKVII